MTLFELALAHPLASGGVVLLGVPLTTIILKVLHVVAKAALDYVFPTNSVWDEYTAGIILRYVYAHLKSFGVSRYTYEARRLHVRADVNQERTVFFMRGKQTARFFFYRGAPMYFSPVHYNGSVQTMMTIMTVRGWGDLSALFRDAGEFDEVFRHRAKPGGGRYHVVVHTGRKKTLTSGNPMDAPMGSTNTKSEGSVGLAGEDRPIGWAGDDIGPATPEDPLAHLSIGGEMARVIRDATFWHSHRDYYRRRGIAWRRGYLLYGSPGNGKTSVVRALAEKLDMPLHRFNLATMDDIDFIEAWNKTREDSPRIVLIEDFDSVFHGRENVVKGSTLSFDTILNTLDGVEREDGLVLFVTTNHVEHIDPALGAPDGTGGSTRPGRIDLTAEFPTLDYEGRVKIAFRIVDDPLAAEELAREGDGLSGARFQERCMQRALADLWSGR